VEEEKRESAEEVKTEERIQEKSPKKPVIESDTEETEGKVEKTEEVEENKVEDSKVEEEKVEKVSQA
jgi:hypothetical protein